MRKRTSNCDERVADHYLIIIILTRNKVYYTIDSMKTMTTKQLTEALHISKKGLLNAARRILPNKVIKHGAPARWTENEVALLTQELTHTSSNNSEVNAQVYTAKSILLDFVDLMAKANCEVNYTVIKSRIFEMNEMQAKKAVTLLSGMMTASTPSLAFRNAGLFADLFDDMRMKHSMKNRIEEKLAMEELEAE